MESVILEASETLDLPECKLEIKEELQEDPLAGTYSMPGIGSAAGQPASSGTPFSFGLVAPKLIKTAILGHF